MSGPYVRTPPSLNRRLQSYNPQGARNSRRSFTWLRPALPCRLRVRLEATVPVGTSLTGGLIGIEWGHTGGGCNQSTLSSSRCRPTDSAYEWQSGSPAQVLGFNRVQLFEKLHRAQSLQARCVASARDRTLIPPHRACVTIHTGNMQSSSS